MYVCIERKEAKTIIEKPPSAPGGCGGEGRGRDGF